MTEAAANALLKTLEEPKPGRFIILVTSRLSSMLPTVRSRCQVVRFNALSIQTVETLLSREDIPLNRVATAAAFSMGSLDRAHAYLEDELDERIDDLLLLLEAAVDQTPIKGLEVIEAKQRGQKKIRDSVIALIDMAPTLLSEILWIKTVTPEAGATRQLVRLLGSRLLEVAKKLSIGHIASFMFLFHNARQAIMNNNMNPQLALESVLMSIRSRQNAMGSEFRLK
jgi:DNA polymerase-3 subunit delta'